MPYWLAKEHATRGLVKHCPNGALQRLTSDTEISWLRITVASLANSVEVSFLNRFIFWNLFYIRSRMCIYFIMFTYSRLSHHAQDGHWRLRFSYVNMESTKKMKFKILQISF